jgi:hypothetical protein
MQLHPGDENAEAKSKKGNFMSKLGKPAQADSAKSDDGKVSALEAQIAKLNSELENARNSLAES